MSRPEDEDAAELRARALLEREFGFGLLRIAPTAVPTADYRSVDSARGVEVKQITSEAYRDLSAAFRAARHWDSTVLSGRWSVLIDRPTLSTALAPMPSFPEDDPDLIADYEASGLRVRRKAGREAEWRASHPGPRQETPRLKDLGRDLEPHLTVLEQGIHPRVVQERLGHSTIAITLGIYSHVSPTLHDEAATLIAGLILPPSDRRSEAT